MALFIVSTPIGNLSDMTYRAVDTLKAVDFIICEDTRKSRILLDHYGIEGKKLLSFHAQSSETKAEELAQKIESALNGAAQISDAGTPGISDPGFKLIKFCIQKGVQIIPIPGASAFLTLASSSGFPVDRFQFLGFLPHKKGRQTFLKNLGEAEISTIFYESVHRFPRFLNEAEEILGSDRQICVGRELTKKFEDIFRGTVKEAQEYFTAENTRGEFVVLVGPKDF